MAGKTCFIILGPTAVGKTALSIKLAELFHTDIISADSRQCYRELDIGVAKPSTEELSRVPHHFVSSHSLEHLLTAADFEAYALAASAEIFLKADTAVMCGGTGLYIRTFSQGIDPVPEIVPAVRELIRRQYAENGMEWLQEQVKKEDPQYYADGEINNPHRLIRALEVVRSTTHSIRTFQQGSARPRNFNIVKIGLELPRPELNARIGQRVHAMMDAGLLEEVRRLLPYRHLPPLNTIGYKELFAFLDGETGLAEAVDKITIHTRQYAKRQMTWFKRDPEIRWFHPAHEEEILSYCREQMQGQT